jgi:hypothetical protein
MPGQSFIEELFAFSEATRGLAVARTAADPELSARLIEIADGLARMARIEALLSYFVDGPPYSRCAGLRTC